ncbi:hypothetical protein [Streptosporangium vulgare]|uniref:hypothetical protein n=1 Tax=Streptosporangium vulgare TaxID=46190 RepID=UPI0031DC5BBE
MVSGLRACLVLLGWFHVYALLLVVRARGDGGAVAGTSAPSPSPSSSRPDLVWFGPGR